MNAAESQLDPLAVSPNTAARLLDIGRSSVYAHMSAGHIKFVQVGADRRIPMEEIRRVAADGLPRLNADKAGA